MKTTVAAMGIALAGFSMAEAPENLPKIKRADANYVLCGDLSNIDFDWTPDSFSILMPDYYQSFSPRPIPAENLEAWAKEGIDADALDVAICPMSFEWDAPAGWRFRFTNVTFSGSAVAEGGAYIGDFDSQNYLYYQRSVLDKELTPQLVNDRTTDPGYANAIGNLGKASDFDGTYKISAEAKTSLYWDGDRRVEGVQWTPCISDDKNVIENLRFFFMAHVMMYRRVGLADPSKAKAAIGKPNRQSDVKVTWGTQWEKCDPAKFDPKTWGWGANYPKDLESKLPSADPKGNVNKAEVLANVVKSHNARK